MYSLGKLLLYFIGGRSTPVSHWEQTETYQCGEDALLIDGTLSRDGHFVAVANNNNEVCIWDTVANELQTLVTLPSYAIKSAWHPNSAWIAILVRQPEHINLTNLHILDGLTGETLTIIDGHPAAQALAWSPDGTRIATGGSDGIIRIWEQP